jgi:serine/threonine protein kinase
MVDMTTTPHTVKWIDFGLCHVMHPKGGDSYVDVCSQPCGSVDFAAPEVILTAMGKQESFDAPLADGTH